jgi:hypothetical protein
MPKLEKLSDSCDKRINSNSNVFINPKFSE